MGQNRQESTGRSGIVFGPRCTCCGRPLSAAVTVQAVLREILYEYCDAVCRDRHAEAVAQEPSGCAFCDLDALGDTGRCAAHLDGEAGDGSGVFPLAS